jgi:hypothetical protein
MVKVPGGLSTTELFPKILYFWAGAAKAVTTMARLATVAIAKDRRFMRHLPSLGVVQKWA